MAIGYRFTNIELATMIDLLGISGFQLLDINTDGLTDEQKKACKLHLGQIGVLHKCGASYSMDAVMQVVIVSIACAESYILSENCKTILIENTEIIIELVKDQRINGIWHVYPFHTVLDLALDEHGRYADDSMWFCITNTDAGWITWKQYMERSIKHE